VASIQNECFLIHSNCSSLLWETDDSRKVRFAHVRETSIALRESSLMLPESSDDPKSTW